MAKNKLTYFMYSQTQIAEKKEVNAKIGRDFLCGEVSVGPKSQKISDVIKSDELYGYAQRFPDYVIVYKGDKARTVYKKPTEPYIGSGKE